MIYHTFSTSLGNITAASDGKNITGLWLEGQKYFGSTLPADAQKQDAPIFAALQDWLGHYLDGENPKNMPPLAPAGTPFRQSVWAILAKIPYGQTLTYGDIAQQLEQTTGQKQSARAVGNAVGHNPISILIPCHRVMGKNNSLTGYAGGLDTKARLLRLEGIALPKGN